ncbi:hypothetical protein [Stackebrandtia soli]|uniref:hypothetical protein n=1 Tax=Stackebrandtia soli TaxID=1892856 RepID=UPI0039ECF353
MTSADELLRALPIRGIRVRAGSYGNCGGVIIAVVDLEPGTAEGVEVVDGLIDVPDWAEDFPDDIELCVLKVGEGVKAGFLELFDAEPAVRLVLRRLKFNLVDAVTSVGPRAGRLVVAEAVRLASAVPVSTQSAGSD